MTQHGPFRALTEQLKAGKLTRRQFIARASALGVALPVTMFVLNALKLNGVAAQDASSGRPETGTESQARGAGGELKILQWQAATHAFAHRGQGTKDLLASSLVLEPLLSYSQEGTLLPTLASEVPTLENDGVSEDLLTVTVNLKEGILWSDGEPFTANDVVFTWQWIMEPSNNSTSSGVWAPIENIEATSDTQVVITFTEPLLAWYVPITGASFCPIIPAHVWEGADDPDAVTQAFLTNPIGTGPYVVTELRENDLVLYGINENYREPNKPYFATVNLKGGGDANSAAQAVLQTGDWHFAWNLQVEPEILKQMEEDGGQGAVHASPPTGVERIMFNFSDPDTEQDGERSNANVPHPILSDIAVRQAISLATDSDTIANQLYLGGDLEPGGRNILTGIPEYESPNTESIFDLEAAAQVLEDAGWVMDGGVRSKDGLELSFSYDTSINSVRQKTQQLNKANFEQIGIEVTLGQIDAGVFFDSAPGNEQTYGHFYRDMQMYTNDLSSPFPSTYMQDWYSGPDGSMSNVAQAANDWSGVNNQRYVNPEYDALYEEVLTTTDSERAAELFIAMNDIVINDYVAVPEVSRAGETYAVSNTLLPENIAASAWEVLYWNIANWTAAEQ